MGVIVKQTAMTRARMNDANLRAGMIKIDEILFHAWGSNQKL